MEKNNRLLKFEEKELVKLLGKIKLPVSYAVFIALSKSVPLVAIDIALMRDKKHLLLTYRNDEFYKGWHIPGSILLYGEEPVKALYRLAKKELRIKLKDLTRIKFQTYLSYDDARGNGITLLFTASSRVKPKDGKYFHLDNLPEDFLEEQLEEIGIIRKLR